MSTLFQSPQKFQPVFSDLEKQYNPAFVSGYTSVPSAGQEPWFRGMETPLEYSCELGNVVWAELTHGKEVALARSEDLDLNQLKRESEPLNLGWTLWKGCNTAQCVWAAAILRIPVTPDNCQKAGKSFQDSPGKCTVEEKKQEDKKWFFAIVFW